MEAKLLSNPVTHTHTYAYYNNIMMQTVTI